MAPWAFESLKTNWSLTDKIRENTTINEVNALFCELISDYGDYIKLYTDGSKSDDGVGYGVFSQNIKISTKISNLETIFSAEAKGIIQAIGLCNLEIGKKKFLILSDSLSVIKSVSNRFNRSSLVQLIRRELVSSEHVIELCWVPSHRNIVGNDEADSLAKKSLEQERCEGVKKT